MFFLILFLSIKCLLDSGNMCVLCAQYATKNSICEFQEGPATNCFMYVKLLNSDHNKDEILDKINSRRNKVSSGKIRSLPPAKNMLKLEWNDELAFLAQRWADQCLRNDLIDECAGTKDLALDGDNIPSSLFDVDPSRSSHPVIRIQPSPVHLLEREANGTIGQNIGTVYGEAPGLNPATFVDLWYMELLSFNANIISNYRPSTASNLQHYEYFTQLIWANTKEVGCGATKFLERLSGNKNRTVHRLVCNFLPVGNINKQSVYNIGKPCSGCFENECDSKYTSLCGQGSDILKKNGKREENNVNPNIFTNSGPTTRFYTNKHDNYDEKGESTNYTDTDISFDLYAHLFNVSNYDDTTKKEDSNTTFCKDAFAIDELIDLLRKKLSTDNTFRDLLLTKSPSGESLYTDPKIDAIVGKIYSKKTPSTTTKPTDSEVVNSTLLADLVEAIIFRNRDKISTPEIIFPGTEVMEAKTVQMQAELGEIQRNLEFTGHYFFPEDSDNDETESTESYYDQSDIPVSEIIIELEELKRKQHTKDFVEDILDSDTNSHTITESHIITTDKDINDTLNLIRTKNNFETWNHVFVGPKEIARVKRNKRTKYQNKYFKNVYTYDEIILNYEELLKRLATDLKKINLNSKLHCSQYSAARTGRPKTITIILTFVYYLFIK